MASDDLCFLCRLIATNSSSVYFTLACCARIQVADLDQIFEPLYSTKSRGVGLGLPLVRRILEQHGGGVTVAGAPREGARVTLWLPQRAPEARAG